MLNDAKRQHDGKYQCVAYNTLGRGDSKEVTVSVFSEYTSGQSYAGSMDMPLALGVLIKGLLLHSRINCFEIQSSLVKQNN